MNLLPKLIATGLTLWCLPFAYAQDDSEMSLSQSHESEMQTAQTSSSCGTPSCAPAPCPKPCPPKPCPPKPCKPPCPPVCFEGGYPNEQCCFPPAYNQAANYDLGPCPWDFWLDVSFTYWQAQEEGLDLAVNSVFNATPLLPTDGRFIFQDNKYKPGFKIGLGMDLEHDDWSGFVEYTWFRSRTNTRATAPADPRTGTPILSMQPWLIAGTDGQIANVNSFSSTWHLNMDLLDVCMTRPFYQGTHLIMAPFGGMRGQWIRQKLHVTGDNFTQSSPTLSSATSSNKSNSWAVGPRAGCLAKWHLGWGFRFEGDVAGSILYTRYTKVSLDQSLALVSDIGLPNNGAQFRNYNCLRAVNEMNLGLGWGSYFGCRNYHFDLLLTYDFQVFWNQNMMRQLADAYSNQAGHGPSNLYLQGLTVKTQFDF